MEATEIQRAIQAAAVLEPLVPEPTVVETLGVREAAPPIPIPFPIPFIFGSRFIIWKQDPTVGALGRRLTYIPRLIFNGPRDARINTVLPGTTPVIRNSNGDFIFAGATPEADCAHTFAVVRQTLTMYERVNGGTSIPWAWNTGGNTSALSVFPRAFAAKNAFYSRSSKSLRFGFFTPSGGGPQVFTCRSLDIVSHEAGHGILDGLKPGWLAFGNPPQTGGLHESFGDLTAIFLALSQFDQIEAFLALTKANLHAKNFLAAVAEQFGAALGRPMGLRNADNNLKLSQVSNEVHAISQVFTGGIYDVLADVFAFERRRQAATKGPTQVLLEVSQNLCKLLLDAIIAAPDVGATYSEVVNRMLTISANRGDPPIYRTFIRNRFSFREVVVSPTPIMESAMARGLIDLDDEGFTDKEGDVTEVKPAFPNHPSLSKETPQDLAGTCGTMQLPEYTRTPTKLTAELKKLSQRDEGIPEEELVADLMADEVKELQTTFA